MPTKPSPREFLQKHLGQHWAAVSYDPLEPGLLGETICIESANENPPKPDGDLLFQPLHHQPNGYLSPVLSDTILFKTCEKLDALGIKEEGNYRIVPDNRGGALLFMSEAIDGLMQNKQLLESTLTQKLIPETGIRVFAQTVANDTAPEPASALDYLNNATHDSVPDTQWRRSQKEFVLTGLDEQSARAAKEALEEIRLSCKVNTPSPHGGDYETTSTLSIDAALVEFIVALHPPKSYQR